MDASDWFLSNGKSNCDWLMCLGQKKGSASFLTKYDNTSFFLFCVYTYTKRLSYLESPLQQCMLAKVVLHMLIRQKNID